MSLSRIQSDYLATIAELGRGGIAPSYSEIAVAMGKSATSKGSVARMVRELEAAGRLRRMPDRARCLEVIPEHDQTPTVYLEGDNFNLIGGPKARVSFLAWYCAEYPAEVRA